VLGEELQNPVGLCPLLEIEDLGGFLVEAIDVDWHM
jgi:hypothetical protein